MPHAAHARHGGGPAPPHGGAAAVRLGRTVTAMSPSLSDLSPAAAVVGSAAIFVAENVRGGPGDPGSVRRMPPPLRRLP